MEIPSPSTPKTQSRSHSSVENAWKCLQWDNLPLSCPEYNNVTACIFIWILFFPFFLNPCCKHLFYFYAHICGNKCRLLILQITYYKYLNNARWIFMNVISFAHIICKTIHCTCIFWEDAFNNNISNNKDSKKNMTDGGVVVPLWDVISVPVKVLDFLLLIILKGKLISKNQITAFK